MESNWGFGDGQVGPCMGRCMAWCMGGCCILPVLARLNLDIGGGLVGVCQIPIIFPVIDIFGILYGRFFAL